MSSPTSAAPVAQDESWPAPRGRRITLPAATVADLAAVRAHVGRECRRACVEPEACDALALAADEVCANVLTHAYAGRPGRLSVDVATGPATLGSAAPPGRGWCRVVVVDAGPPFDPTANPAATAPPPGGAIESRRVGGLGLFLVRGSVEHLTYERAGSYNVLTLERGCGLPASPPVSHHQLRMQISITQEHDVTVVSAAGSLDALTADQFADALLAEVRTGRVRLVAGLAEVDYTSSAGLRALLTALKAARHGGGDLRVAGAQERVQRVLALSGFTGILKCYADVPSAVASWRA